MSTSNLLLVLLLALAGGCKTTDCGEGTIDRNGTCVGADQTVGTAMCGPFTKLEGTQCVPMFPPTVCDPSTTSGEEDPQTHVTTCIGTGAGGCSAPFACPSPTAGKQTICGQIYDFETGMPFAQTGAVGQKCAAGATSGPCSLGIRAYDAIEFGTNPSTAQPLATDAVYIDDCGRYRVPNITVPSGPFIGLGIDDADSSKMGPAGTTNIVGVATPKIAGSVTKDFEGYIVAKSTTDAWAASGGPPISGGIYAVQYRGHKKMPGNDPVMGVTFTRNGTTVPANDYYFMANQANKTTIDTAATATGINGTALVTGATVADNLAYSGMSSGLPAECRWEQHAGASLPMIVFIQIYRPTDNIPMTCSL